MSSVYSTDEAIAEARSEWSVGLRNVDTSRIGPAIDKMVDAGHEWPPSLPEFVKLCEPSYAELGIPTAQEAWQVVCRGDPGGDMTVARRWKHPVIFAAAKDPALDIWNLRLLSLDVAMRTWQKIYQSYVDRMTAGEEFAFPSAPALEAPKPEYGSKEEKRASSREWMDFIKQRLADRMSKYHGLAHTENQAPGYSPADQVRIDPNDIEANVDFILGSYRVQQEREGKGS